MAAFSLKFLFDEVEAFRGWGKKRVLKNKFKINVLGKI